MIWICLVAQLKISNKFTGIGRPVHLFMRLLLFFFLFCISTRWCKIRATNETLTESWRQRVRSKFTFRIRLLALAQSNTNIRNHQTTIDIRFCDTFASQKRFLFFSFCSWWICGRFSQTSWPVWGYVRDRFDVFCFVLFRLLITNTFVCVCERVFGCCSFVAKSFVTFLFTFRTFAVQKRTLFFGMEKEEREKTIVNIERPFPFFLLTR